MAIQTSDKAYATLPETGESQDTWGSELNTAIQDLSQTVNGYLEKSVAGSSNVTLTDEEARDAFIKCTGTLTGNISVIVPAREGPYLIWNATSGSYTLTVKTSGGTGIEVPQGYVYALFCDATNVIRPVSKLKNVEIAQYTETVQQLGTVSAGTTTINIASGNIAKITAATGTVALAFTGWPSTGTNATLSLEIVNGGRWSVTWPSAVKWSGGSTPTLTSTGTDWVNIWGAYAGTALYGNALTNFS